MDSTRYSEITFRESISYPYAHGLYEMIAMSVQPTPFLPIRTWALLKCLLSFTIIMLLTHTHMGSTLGAHSSCFTLFSYPYAHGLYQPLDWLRSAWLFLTHTHMGSTLFRSRSYAQCSSYPYAHGLYWWLNLQGWLTIFLPIRTWALPIHLHQVFLLSILTHTHMGSTGILTYRP